MAWARLNQPTGPLDLTPGPLDRLIEAMERLTATYTAAPWLEEMSSARQEFEQSRGKVYEDEPMYEAQLAAFLEWYVLDRPLSSGGQAPVVKSLWETSAAGDSRSSALRALALSFRSLFEVVEVFHSETLLRDLLRGGLWRVKQEPPLAGVDAADVFEARLVPSDGVKREGDAASGAGEVRFGPIFSFHPRAARSSILQVVETLNGRGASAADVLSALGVMRLNHERFRTIAVDRIYSLSWRGGAGRGDSTGAARRAKGAGEVSS